MDFIYSRYTCPGTHYVFILRTPILQHVLVVTTVGYLQLSIWRYEFQSQ